MADQNDFNQKINNDEQNDAKDSGTVWNGDSYHGYQNHNTADGPAYSSSSTSGNGSSDAWTDSASGAYQAKPQSTASQAQYNPYGGYSPYSWNSPHGNAEPKKEKNHTVRRVLVGVLACLVVSAGSIAAFAALINNGTIKIQQNGSNSAFTIVKSSSTPTTNTSATASELSKQEVAKKVLPSVVCIENYSSTSSQKANRSGSDQFGSGDDNNGGFSFSGGSGDQGGGANGSDGTTGSDVSPASEGSGIIMTTDGYIITNAHVVSGESALKVVLSNGKTYSAQLIGSDSITDLALIKIDASGLTAAEFGSSNSLQVADSVMAVGNPGGLEFNSSVTVGYVSALNREITNSETGFTMKCIQTDAAINPGNSGGALVNMKGQVVGINSSKIVATGYEGLGFAIPIDTVQPIISQLKQYGYVKDRAMLGVSGGYIDSMSARFYGFDSTGFYVSSVTSQYISAAGIQKGDVITKIDNQVVANQNTIASVIASKKPGDTVTLTVSRATTGKTFTATVKLTQATGKS